MQNLKTDYLSFKAAYVSARDVISAKLEGTGLTVEQWAVLDSINPGISCTDLAAKSGLLGPSMSRMLMPLEGYGLIKTEQDKTDARYKKITLTTKGQKLLDDVQKRCADV